MLVKFINSKKESWEDYLDTCVYAYNSAKHESSKFSPFEVMFGRKAVLPVDLDGARACEDELLVMEDFNTAELERMMEERRARLEVVQANILAAQERQKEQYDRKHSNPEVFRVGSLVLKKDFTRKKHAGGKLDHKWLGPYRISGTLGRGLYRLEDVKNPTKVVSRVNGVHLKQYLPPTVQVCI